MGMRLCCMVECEQILGKVAEERTELVSVFMGPLVFGTLVNAI